MDKINPGLGKALALTITLLILTSVSIGLSPGGPTPDGRPRLDVVAVGMDVCAPYWAGYECGETPEQELAKVQKTIKQEGLSWKAGMNPIAMLSRDERRRLLGLKPPNASRLREIEERQQKNRQILRDTEITTEPIGGLPDSFDWRDRNGENYITPIKAQGDCGSCWAFAGLAALEASANIHYDNPDLDLDLSEQDLITCYLSDGCCGAYDSDIEYMFSTYFQNTGVSTEKCFPYEACDSIDNAPCDDCTSTVSCSNKCPDWQDDAWKTNGYVSPYLTIDAIKETIMDYGPVEVGMEVYTDFFGYTGGIYEPATPTLAGYHAVTIVGWGKEATVDYWIVKNSWGTSWGEDGYFRIKMGECDIDSWFAFAVILDDECPPDFKKFDLNDDKWVDMGDLFTITKSGYWGCSRCEPGYEDFDLNGDKAVDMGDLFAVTKSGYWSEECP